MLEISRFYGIIVTMYFPDHNPPHFHVRYDEYRAIVYISTGVIIGDLPKRAAKLIHEWMQLHQAELWENWRKMERGESLSLIKPLD
ncbi:MAG: DUF4160 domain-containing protein [Bacteroidales bacterium]|nr:DUF4160 domain-containing protein [Bacteroidales bacterium]